jgi:acetyltransferase-like isoleucine patch superfamily enzyme
MTMMDGGLEPTLVQRIRSGIRTEFSDEASNCHVVIGENCRLDGLSVYFDKPYCLLEIGNNTSLSGVIAFRAEGGVVRIGHDTEVQDWLAMEVGAPIIIGESGRMNSARFCSVEPHDAEEAEPDAVSENRPIVLGDHVRLSDEVLLLGGAELGDGVVIAPRSTVGHAIPSYSMAAGSPARVVRRNIRCAA